MKRTILKFAAAGCFVAGCGEPSSDQIRSDQIRSDQIRSDQIEGQQELKQSLPISVFFKYDAKIDWESYSNVRKAGFEKAKLNKTKFSATAESRVAAQQLAVEVKANHGKLRLPPKCASTVEFAKYSPFGWCETTINELSKVKNSPLILFADQVESSSKLIASGPGQPWQCGPITGGPHNSVDAVAENLRTDCPNQNGYFGEGFPLGQIDSAYRPYTQNSYWSMTPVKFEDSGAPQASKQYPRPLGGVCNSTVTLFPRSEHATLVASMMGSYDHRGGDPHQAANAEFFNSTTPFKLKQNGDPECDTLGKYVGALEWLAVEEGVRVMNESYRCGGVISTRGYVRDFFSRFHDLIIVRAAGNIEEGLTGVRANCPGNNVICVGAHDMGGQIGGTNSNPHFNDQHAIWSLSKYGDPLVYWPGGTDRRTDREEPDVVAAGTTILGLWDSDSTPCGDCGDAFNSGQNGTSFAAPQIAGMIALAAEQVQGSGWQSCRLSEWARALVKVASIDHTRFLMPPDLDEASRTSRLARHAENWGSLAAEDERHGAGSPEFDKMLGFSCPSEKDAWISPDDQETIEWDDLEPLDRVHPNMDRGPDHPSTGGLSQTVVGFEYDVDEIGTDPSSTYEPKFQCTEVAREESDVWLYRVVFEWSSCPDGTLEDPANGVSYPATDFNLALQTPSGERFWMSTSFDDNSESFEFCRTEPGEYRVAVIPTTEQWGCRRKSGDPDSKKGEFRALMKRRTRVNDPERDCPELRNFGYGF